MKAQRLAVGATSALLGLLFAAGCVVNPSVSVGPYSSSVGTGEIAGDFSTIASDVNVSAELAATPSTLFWVDRGSGISDAVFALSVSADSPTELYTVSPDPTAAIEDITADTKNVYVAQLSASSGLSSISSQIVAVPQDGSTPKTLASASDTFTDLVVGGTSVYYSNGVALFRVPVAGGKSETVAGSGTEGIVQPTIGGLLSNAGAVYWTEADPNTGETDLMTITSSATKGTKLTQFAGPSTPLLAADSSNLFWVATSAEGVSYVVDAPTGGSKTLIVASTPDAIAGLVADDTNVYYLDVSADDGTQSLIEVPIAGGASTTLVTEITPPTQGDSRHALALDDVNVYFAESGALLSVAK